MTKCLGSCTQDGSVHHTTLGQRCHCCKQEWPCAGPIVGPIVSPFCVTYCCSSEIQDTHHTLAGRSCHKCQTDWPCQSSGVAKRRAQVEEAKKTSGCVMRGSSSCPDAHHTTAGRKCHKCNADWPCPAFDQDVLILTSCGGTPFRSVRGDNARNLWAEKCYHCRKPLVNVKTNREGGLPLYVRGHLKDD